MTKLYTANLGAAFINFALIFHSFGFETNLLKIKILNYVICQVFIWLGLWIAISFKEGKK